MDLKEPKGELEVEFKSEIELESDIKFQSDIEITNVKYCYLS